MYIYLYIYICIFDFTTIYRSGMKPPSFRVDNLKQSVKFLLPSVIYAINNNIYFKGLLLVPPPVWLILTSFRTVVTASLYKVGLYTVFSEIF